MKLRLITKKLFGFFPALFIFAVSEVQTDWGFVLKPELGIIKYQIRTTSLHDVSDNLDSIVPGSVRIAPVVRCAWAMEYDDLKLFKSRERTCGRLGVALEYIRRGNTAVVSDYFDSGFATASLEARQNIQRFNALFIGEYDAFVWRWLTASIGAGVGLTHNALTDFRLYQKSNGAFIGQAIEPKYFNPHGYIGVSFKKSCTHLDNVQYELGYRLGLTRLAYRERIAQSKPDTTADVAAQNAYEFFRDLNLAQAPTSTMFSHQISFGVQIHF